MEPGPGPEPPEPKPWPPEPRPPVRGRRVVEHVERQGMAAAEARKVLGKLQSDLDGDADLRLDLSWEIYKPEEAR